MNPLLSLNALLEAELLQLNKVIAGHYKDTKIDLIHKVVENLILSGGKRIRPILTLALCKLFNETDERCINAAAAIELIHTATLLHDDVVDDADMRRDARTAKKIWGNKTSILVGDFLLSAAFNCATSCDDMSILRILSDATLVIAEGEVKQLINVNNIHLSYSEYLTIISSKTAKLFEAACSIAAILTKNNVSLFAKFGHALGMAFQIVDDVKDYNSSSGKDRGKDFANSKVTLPIIIAYQESNEQEKVFWQNCIVNQENQDLEQAIDLLKAYGAFNKSLIIAQDHISICEGLIKVLPMHRIKALLSELIQSIIR